MEDISSSLLIPIHNSSTLPTMKKIEDNIMEISDAVCKMHASISNLKRLKDKYLINLKQYQTDYSILLQIYETMKQDLVSESRNNFSNDFNAQMMMNDYSQENQSQVYPEENPSLLVNHISSPAIIDQQHISETSSYSSGQQITQVQSIHQSYSRDPKKHKTGDEQSILLPTGIPEPSPKSLISSTNEPAQMSIDNIPWQITNHSPNNNYNVKLRFALRTPAVLCSVQFDPQGKCIAFSDGKLLHIISSENGALMYSLEIPKSSNRNDLHTRVIKFSPDGKLIAINSKSSSISIFSTETRKCIGNLEGHTKTVSALLFLKGRPNISSNVPQHPQASNFNYGYGYSNYNYGGSGGYNYSGYGGQNFSSAPQMSGGNPNGFILISGSYDGLLCIWDLQTMSLIKILQHGSETSGKLNHEGAIVSLATEPDESFICVGFMKGTVGIYEPTFTQPLNSFVAHNEYLHSVKTVPNESAIVTTSHDKTAKLWGLHTIASCKHVFKGHKDFVICAEVAPPDIVCNNKYKNKYKCKNKIRTQNPLMLTGSKDETLKGWNRETGEELFSITGHKNTLFEINHHPFEMSFVSCSGDGLVCMWDYLLPS